MPLTYWSSPFAKVERNEGIYLARKAGMKNKEIAAKFGVQASKVADIHDQVERRIREEERIHRLAKEDSDTGRYYKEYLAKRAKRDAKRNAKHQK